MLGELSPWHLAILAGVVVLLFGTKKLPDAARSLGQSMRIFKTEVRGLRDDVQPPPAVVPAPLTAPAPSAPAPATVTEPAPVVAPAPTAPGATTDQAERA